MVKKEDKTQEDQTLETQDGETDLTVNNLPTPESGKETQEEGPKNPPPPIPPMPQRNKKFVTPSAFSGKTIPMKNKIGEIFEVKEELVPLFQGQGFSKI